MPRQLETLDILHQGKIGIESQGFQGGGRSVQIIQRQASAGAKQPIKGRTWSRAAALQMLQPGLKVHLALGTS